MAGRWCYSSWGSLLETGSREGEALLADERREKKRKTLASGFRWMDRWRQREHIVATHTFIYLFNVLLSCASSKAYMDLPTSLCLHNNRMRKARIR